MAFGKDQKQLGEISTFRQSVRQYESMKPKQGGGGGVKPYFIDAFKPSTDEPDTVRIVKGNYPVQLGQPDGTIVTVPMTYYPFVEHYHAALKKNIVCSAGPLGSFKGKGQPCLACDIFWADRNAGRKNGPMSRRELHSVTVLHYAPYAHVEQIDRTTGAIRTDSEGKPYMQWVRVHDYERNKYAGKEMVEARRMHWEIGSAHWNTLIDYNKEIGRSCKSCGGRDTVKMAMWTCGSCGEILIDGATTTLSPKEIEEITDKEVRCASCHEVGYLDEQVVCSNCDNGVRAEIFDVDIKVKRVAPKDGGNQTILAITGWSNPGPIDNRFAEIAKPLDLPKVFTPTPYDKQQQLLGGAQGRSPVTTGHSRGYGAPTLGPGGKTGPQY